MSDDGSRAEHQKAAEAEVERFHNQFGPFVVAAENTRTAMVFTNAKEPDHPIVFANDSFLRLMGYERGEVMGRSFDFLLAHDADPGELAKVEAEFDGELDERPEIACRRKNGETLWVAFSVTPVRDVGGQIVQHFCSFLDLTRHRHEQVHARMLIDELNHRVKNTLVVVQSIVSQALRNGSDIDDAREAIEARLLALSRSHDLLTRERWISAGLRDVVVNAVTPFGVAGGRVDRLTIRGADIRFPPNVVLALSVALHELATNAVKYGAFSNDAGRVQIDWSVHRAAKGDRVVLRWCETDGPPVAPPVRKGFGSQVIERGLAHELDGDVSVDYRPGGLVCTIDMPAPQGSSGE